MQHGSTRGVGCGSLVAHGGQMTKSVAMVLREGQTLRWCAWERERRGRDVALGDVGELTCSVATSGCAAAIVGEQILAWEWCDGAAMPVEVDALPAAFKPRAVDVVAGMLVVGGADKASGQSLL